MKLQITKFNWCLKGAHKKTYNIGWIANFKGGGRGGF